MDAPSASLNARRAMHSDNKLQIGLFGANCSSGRAVTLIPERWSGSWPDNKKLALMADQAGIDFLLPIGRWKGYGGTTDYQGTTLETVTWATALLAITKRITVFGTVHAPIFNPVVAAKEMVTADHVGEGRFGLNIVVGWNEGEFDMFGVEQRAHEQRYEYAQEWIDVIKMIWSDREDFDFHGKYLDMKGIRGKPKPYGGTRPVIMNAGASPTGQAFAVKNCDAFFLQASRTSLEESAQRVRRAKEAARAQGHEIGCYTVGVVTCRPTKKEAEDYFHHCIVEHADWSAVDGILGLKNISPQTVPMQEYLTQRSHYAQGMGGLPIVGDPDHVAAQIADLSKAGLTGIAISLVNYLDELPYFIRRGDWSVGANGTARETAELMRSSLRSPLHCARSDVRLSPAYDRRAPLLVVAVDRHALPNAVDVIGIAAGKGVDCSTVRGVDDENAADRRLAVVGHQRARGHHVDRMLLGAVEMDAMVAVMLGAGRQNMFFVERVDHIKHALF